VAQDRAEAITFHGYGHIGGLDIVCQSDHAFNVFNVDRCQFMQPSQFGGVEFTYVVDNRLSRFGKDDLGQLGVPRRHHVAVLAGRVL
jgi:hypothetical protein